MTDRQIQEQTGFRPNPNETVPPQTANDAFEDLLRFMAAKQTRAQVIEELKAVDPSKIVFAVQGVKTGPLLTNLELMIGNTVEYCVREGLLRSPIQAVGAIEGVRQEVLDGGVFVGTEKFPKQL